MSGYSPYMDHGAAGNRAQLNSSPVAMQRSMSGTNVAVQSTYHSPGSASSLWTASEDGNGKAGAFQTYPKRDGILIDSALDKSELLGLDMSGVRIKRLPMELFQFAFLTELRLANNFLASVPSEIGLLRTLTALDLSNNQLSTLPRELSKLTNLTELLLYNNQLTMLPAEFGYLYQLQSFGLEGNPIMEPILSVLHNQGALMVIPFLRDHMISTRE